MVLYVPFLLLQWLRFLKIVQSLPKTLNKNAKKGFSKGAQNTFSSVKQHIFEATEKIGLPESLFNPSTVVSNLVGLCCFTLNKESEVSDWGCQYLICYDWNNIYIYMLNVIACSSMFFGLFLKLALAQSCTWNELF